MNCNCIDLYMVVVICVSDFFCFIGFVEYCFNLVMLECEINWFKYLVLIIFLFVFYFFLFVIIMIVVYVIIFKEVCRNICRIFVIECVV